MSMQNTLESIYDHHKKISTLDSISNVLYWDFETMMPKNSSQLRSDQLSYLNAAAHNLRTNASYVDNVMSLDIKSLATPEDQRHITKLKKSLARALCIDEAFVKRLTDVSLKCHEKWKAAREASSFALVKNDLTELVGLQREFAVRARDFAALKPYYQGKSAYEVLIDEYEPGISSEYLRTSLKHLVESTNALLPEIEAKQKSQTAPKPIALPTDDQHKIVLKVAHALGFDFTRGRIDKSVHPFCGGHPNDTRMTTRYREDDATDAVWSTIHEAGHALYEQNLPPRLLGLPCGSAASMGVHESQSRFYENQIAKSLPFCQWIAPDFGVSPQELYAILNRVQKSFIRVDADEVTYNLHVYLRFELEERLIEGKLAVADLEDAWNAEFLKTFGMSPATPLQGVLQDTHWYGGAFGYFPTYSLGNLLAAELFAKYQAQFPDWQDLVRQGSFVHIREFMNKNVHSLAALDDSPATMQKILGGKLPNPDTLVTYFRAKFL
ncbi:MAG TPA: carboxypeptidase M32 [Bdellovibrionota bacterium]|jgi:carboxypeptidase Taq|nr:carboxypeptidase M32 [Bdellovibrionota bacterium]